MERKAYPSDVSDEEWAFVAPYLTLITEEAPQRVYDLREVAQGRNAEPTAVILDSVATLRDLAILS